jgi:hypothetical protein
MDMVAPTRHFEYPLAAIRDLQVRTTTGAATGRPVASHVVVNGEAVVPTERFWNSLFARHHFNQSFFRYFTHEEVFQRIAEVEPRDRMRLCVERDERGGEPRLLAVSNPTKAIVRYDDLLEMLELYEGEKIGYCNGVVESFHTPRLGGSAFDIAGDTFNNRFVVSVPIDGFGLPNIYLSLLRQVCANQHGW